MRRFVYRIRDIIRNLPIRRKLLLLLFVQMLLPILVTGFLSYRKSADVLKDKSIMYTNDILSMIEVRLDDYFDHLELYSQDILYDQSVYDLLDATPANEEQYTRAVYNLFNRTIMSRPEIKSLCLADITKKIRATADDNSKSVQIRALLMDSALINDVAIQAERADGRQIVFLDIRNGRVENIYMARMFNSTDDYVASGYLIMLLDRDYIKNIFEGLVGEEAQNVYIVNENREIIASTQEDESLLLNGKVWDQLEANREWVIDNDAGILVSQRYLSDLGWRIVSWNSSDVVFGEINDLRRLLIIINTIAIACFSALSLYIASDLVRPIRRLVDAMRLVQRGASKADVVVDRYDELGYLSATFNTMVEETNRLVNRVYREQITKKDAEIKALQTQINPHFLFNTLESVNWIARLHHVDEISEMITDLSTIMEASIGRGSAVISLEEELAYIDTYVNILKKRYGDRLNMKRDVEERLLAIEIPRLLLQPLIENAIYHGIDQKREGGEIRIRGYVRNGLVYLEVTDNGMGMTEKEVRAINARLSIDSDQYFVELAESAQKSVGIENVNRRIKLYFGEEYGISIKSRHGCYTRVIMTFPYIPKHGRKVDV